MVPMLTFLIALAAVPEVEVTTLDGASRGGQLVSMTANELVLETADGPQTLPLIELKDLRFGGAAEPAAADQPPIDVRLSDASLLRCTSFTAAAPHASVHVGALGELSLPAAAIRSVRLQPLDGKVEAAWTNLQDREIKTDMLVVRKGDVLDFVNGVIGEINETSITLLLNDREAAVPRERVFGLLYASRAAPGKPVGEMLLSDGSRLFFSQVAYTEGTAGFAATTAAGPKVTAPVENVRAIDFGLGRIRELADLEAGADYEAVGIFTADQIRETLRVFNSKGAYQLGKRTYTRGVWLHSGMTVRYRLNRDYRRLEAVMGVDRGPSDLGGFTAAVHVTITADGKPLLDAAVTADDEPRDVSLDVAGVRDLEIRVRPERPSIGAGEWLILAEARAIK